MTRFHDSTIAPEFSVAGPTARYLTAPAATGGVTLGSSDCGGDLAVDLFRPAPTRIAVVGEQSWLPRLLVVRSAGFGVAAVVATDRPAPWQQFLEAIGGARPVATLRTDHAAPLPAPTVDAPLLIIEDASGVPPEMYAPQLAWQTTVHVIAQPSTRARERLTAADLVLLCRLPIEPAKIVCATLGRGEDEALTLAALDPHEVFAVADRRAVRVSVTPTPTEARLL